MKFGYRRCGKEQTEEEQSLLQKIQQQVSENSIIFTDEKSSENHQEQYYFLRQLLQAEDYLYIDRLDSLGANFVLIADEWEYITKQIGANIVVVDSDGYLNSERMKITDVENASQQEYLLFILRYLNNMQRKRMRESQRQGIAKALRQGKQLGRPRLDWDWDLFSQTAERWGRKEITVKEACQIMQCTRSSWYKYTKQKGYRSPQRKKTENNTE